ncbi:hypothetical protein [Methylophaga thalassica]|uniref:Uncharacterized protein n=1 Tax=Methylophaga thalassica TaxID=40223 RepID=A0ABQ5TVZ5_9GAMM|nr:hypothetical protein [Methylophaga thalassica]WVI84879.1 hypothetical protein VSX76_14005 [Methylophaga thalassica]GLP99955.1 hypothetical protein GCM10007891_18090 [Methylophaga thalassica]
MNTSLEDFFIVREQQLFRIRNGKEKLMCIAYPELVDITNEGNKSSPIAIYHFHIHSNTDSNFVSISLPGNKLATKTALSNLMASKIPFAKFWGNQNDFDNFLRQSFSECFSKNKVT